VPNFLAAIYGGVISGVGIAIVLRTGASTGGMDIPPLIIHKFTGIEIGSLVMIVDTITVLCGLYVYGLEAVLVGLISVYTCSIAITKTMAFPGSSAKSVQIISDYWEAINQKINHEMDRGTTLLAAQGGYTGDKKKVILVVLNNNEYSKLLSIIDEIDSNAFMIVSETTEVHGEGFTIEARI
ncbi:MAG: YitT family protein, partial [Erysipelotrichaceae bacterium]